VQLPSLLFAFDFPVVLHLCDLHTAAAPHTAQHRHNQMQPPAPPEAAHQQPPHSPSPLQQAGAAAALPFKAALEACPSRAAAEALRLTTTANKQSQQLCEFVLENVLVHEAAAQQLQVRGMSVFGDEPLQPHPCYIGVPQLLCADNNSAEHRQQLSLDPFAPFPPTPSSTTLPICNHTPRPPPQT